MKRARLYLFFLAMLCITELMAQQSLLAPPQPVYTTVRQWQAAPTTDSVALWSFGFGEDTAQTALLLQLLKNQYVTKVQLVYTKFSTNRNFDQQQLNMQRVQRLATLHPEWFDATSGIDWEFVEQTGCGSVKGCSGYFHGFVFYYMSQAKANVLYRRSLLSPRKVARMEEVDAFNYWFDETINKDKRYTELPKDTVQSTLGALNKPETEEHQQQRVEEIVKAAQEKPITTNELPARSESKPKKEKKGRENAPPPAGEPKSDKPEEKPETTATQDLPARTDEVKNKEKKPDLTPIAKKEEPIADTKPVKQKKTHKANEKHSTVLDLFYEVTYPKDKKNAPTWTQYIMQLLRKRKEHADGWIIWLGWGVREGQCDSICPWPCVPPPLDSLCKDCFIPARDKHRILVSDGTVQASMQRLSASYSHMSVTGDVTLGMLGHMQELIYWANNPRNVVQISKAEFYNDGNATPDASKVIGKTGGLYHTDVFASGLTDEKSILYAQMRMFGTLCHAARGGDGGDVPENAIEACADAQSRSTDCDAFILIADNRSPVRDISLLHDITQPLQIILPLVKKEKGLINTEYLDMARQTHGVIHILERAYHGLDQMKEGEVLDVYEYKYKLIKDHFVCIQVAKEPVTE